MYLLGAFKKPYEQIFTFTFTHLADAFIQSDLQHIMLCAIAIHCYSYMLFMLYIYIVSMSSQVTFIYIALLTIQIVTKHCTI